MVRGFPFTVMESPADGLGTRICRSAPGCTHPEGRRNLAVADFSGSGTLDDRLNGWFNELVVDRDLEADLVQEVDLGEGAFIGLGIPALRAAADDVGDSHLSHFGIDTRACFTSVNFSGFTMAMINFICILLSL